MIDVKKLVTAFLILGSAAAGSSLILATVGAPASSSVTPVAAEQDTGAAAAPTALIGSNAFLPQSSGGTQDTGVDYASLPLVSDSADPSNLTDTLADAFVNGTIKANPSGLQDDGSGNAALASPDLQAVALAVASTTGADKMKLPDWALEADAQAIKKTTDSAANVSSYSDLLNNILNKRFVSTGVGDLVSGQNPDSSRAGYVKDQVQGALDDTLGLTTPASLVDFQKSLVKILVYQKNMLALAASVGNDPVKASLTLQSQESDYTAALSDFQNQMQAAQKIDGFSLMRMKTVQEKGPVAFIKNLFGIPTAHALFGLGDIVFDPAVFGRMILDYVHNIILQILKNTLIALVQRKVLSWVQGSGAPRFITSWATDLINSYEQTALNAIDSKMSCVYPGYAGNLQLTLTLFHRPVGAGNEVCANTFQAALGGNTFNQFLNNFSNGSWLAYGANTLPSGNYGLGLHFLSQTVDLTASNQQEAAQAKAVANQGQKGDQVCPDGSNPNGTRQVCVASDGRTHGAPCLAGEKTVTVPNNGYCATGATGDPRVTTPGLYTGFSVNTALDSNPKLITAANDIVGLLSALTTSLLNSLANIAINAATGAVNGGIGTVPPGGIQGGGAPPPPIPLACSPTSQVVSSTIAASLGATGGTNDASGNPPVYSWASPPATPGAGYIYNPVYNFPGIYTVTLTDNTGDAPATCRVVVQ